MRLTAGERAAITENVLRCDPGAKIYLFGSRTNDRLRGGDIDLLVLSERISLADKLDILARVKEAVGEQKIDFLIKNARDAASDPFIAEIMKSAISLK